MKHELFPWLILFLPLLSVAVITLFTLRSKTVEQPHLHRRGGGGLCDDLPVHQRQRISIQR
jgi:hypothetical protein